LTGTWISRVTTQGTIYTTIGTDTAATIDLVERTVITKSGSTITARFDICKLSTTGTMSDSSFSINYGSVSSLFTTSPTEPDFPAYIGGSVSFPDFVIMTGWNSSGSAVDSDSDGNPGITLPVTAVGMSFDAYTGLTINTVFENMTLQTATSISGTVDFSANGHIFDAYYAAFSYHTGDMGVLTVTPSSNAIAVNLIKLTGTVSCSTVLTHCTGASCVP
jgi:hypothetical protein